MPHILRVLVALALVGGCASQGDFPSLTKRAVEDLPMEEPIRVDPPVAARPALRQRAAALLAAARGGDAAFDGAYATALSRVRAAGASGSDSWVQAQEAVSRAEVARGATAAALLELNQLLIANATEPTSPEDHAALMAAVASADRLAAAQIGRLHDLRQRLGR